VINPKISEHKTRESFVENSMPIILHGFCTKRKTCEVPVNSWISSVIPKVLPRYLAGLHVGLELEHLALPERKFEHNLDFVEHSCLYQYHHHLLNSTHVIQSAISFGTATCAGMLSALVTSLKADGKFGYKFPFYSVIVAFSIIVPYSSSHQYVRP